MTLFERIELCNKKHTGMKSGKEKFQFRLKKAERASKRRGTASIAAYSII
jgi:hypothetical protein